MPQATALPLSYTGTQKSNLLLYSIFKEQMYIIKNMAKYQIRNIHRSFMETRLKL